MSTFSKKVTSAVAGLAVVFSMVAPIAGVSAAYNAADAADKLATLGVIVDQSANKAAYRLADTTSRQELSKIIVKLGGLEVKEGESVFKDTNFASWAEKYAKALNEAGYAASNDYFNPTYNATKIEALKWVMDARGIASGTGDNWMANRVKGAVDAGIATAFTDYNADVSRGQVFIWAANAVEAKDDTTVDESLCSILGTCPTEPTTPSEPTTPVVSGDDKLEVSLSPLSPTSGVVAAATPRTPVLAFDVTAGSSDVTLEEVRLDYTGLSNYADIDTIKMYIGNDQVSRGTGKDMSSDKYVEISFENDTVIRAGETKTVVVTAEVQNSNANSVHKLTLTNLEASSDVSGDNVEGMTFNAVLATNVGQLDLDVDQVTGSDVKVGEEITLADFELEEKLDNEDVHVKSLTFQLAGSMDHEDDITDIVLHADGKVVASDLKVNKDEEIVVDLDVKVAADEKVAFMLKAVVTGSVTETISASITEVYAVGADTGINAQLVGDAMGTSTAAARTIEGSDINVSFDKSDLDEAKPDAEEVKVGTLKLSTDGDYNLEMIQVKVDYTANSSAVTGVIGAIDKVELDGKSADTVSSVALATPTSAATAPVAGDTTVYYYFKDVSLNNESKDLDLTFDVVNNTALNTSSLRFTTQFVAIEDEKNDEKYPTDAPLNTVLSSNSLDSKSLVVETASVTFTSVSVNNRLVVLGNNVETVVYRGKINVGDADGINISDMNFVEDTPTNTLSVDLKDVVDSATLNIGGKTFDADIDADSLDFRINHDVPAGSDNVEVLVTAILKDNQSVANGEVLKLELDTTALQADVEDSDGNTVAAANVKVSAANDTVKTQTTLRDKGQFTIKVLQDVDSDDNLENTVLAGSNGVTLAELEMQAEYEDTTVRELTFVVAGIDLSTTLDNVKLMKGASELSSGAAVVEFDGTDTLIKFENDFTVLEADNLIEAELVANVNNITGEGDAVSAVNGNVVIAALNNAKVVLDVKGSTSDDAFTTANAALVRNTTASETVNIVPTMLTPALVASLNSSTIPRVKISADAGSNTDSSSQSIDTLVEQITFSTLGTTDADTSLVFQIVNVDDSTDIVTGTLAGTVLTFDLTSMTNVSNRTVEDGSTQEYKVIVTGGTVDADTLTLTLPKDGVQYGTAAPATTGLTINLDNEMDFGARSY